MYYHQIEPNSKNYNDFIQNGRYWRKVVDKYWASDTLPKYCWVCFSFKSIQLHHENYDVLGHELERDNLRTFILSCQIVPVCSNCHYLLTFDESGEMIPQKYEFLKERRLELRKQYIKQYLRSNTLIPFIKQLLYRIFW